MNGSYSWKKTKRNTKDIIGTSFSELHLHPSRSTPIPGAPQDFSPFGLETRTEDERKRSRLRAQQWCRPRARPRELRRQPRWRRSPMWPRPRWRSWRWWWRWSPRWRWLRTPAANRTTHQHLCQGFLPLSKLFYTYTFQTEGLGLENLVLTVWDEKSLPRRGRVVATGQWHIFLFWHQFLLCIWRSESWAWINDLW